MTAVASTFGIFSNRNSGSMPGCPAAPYGAGPGQAIFGHTLASAANANYPIPYVAFEVPYKHSRHWTAMLGSLYDWLTVPAPPPATVLISQERSIMRRVGGRIFGRVN